MDTGTACVDNVLSPRGILAAARNRFQLWAWAGCLGIEIVSGMY